jgi:hypothetical protein
MCLMPSLWECVKKEKLRQVQAHHQQIVYKHLTIASFQCIVTTICSSLTLGAITGPLQHIAHRFTYNISTTTSLQHMTTILMAQLKPIASWHTWSIYRISCLWQSNISNCREKSDSAHLNMQSLAPPQPFNIVLSYN